MPSSAISFNDLSNFTSFNQTGLSTSILPLSVIGGKYSSVPSNTIDIFPVDCSNVISPIPPYIPNNSPNLPAVISISAPHM